MTSKIKKLKNPNEVTLVLENSGPARPNRLRKKLLAKPLELAQPEPPPKRRPRRKSSYRPEYAAAVRKLGAKGHVLSDAAAALGVPLENLRYWEKTRPEFTVAIAKVRENSERWKVRRYERLLLKSENQLLRALAHVRAKRAAEIEKIKSRYGERILLDDRSIDEKKKQSRTRA